MATIKQLSICERHAKFVIESRQHIDKLDLNDNKNDEKNEWYSDGWNWYIHKYVINTTLKIRIKRTNYNNIKKSIKTKNICEKCWVYKKNENNNKNIGLGYEATLVQQGVPSYQPKVCIKVAPLLGNIVSVKIHTSPLPLGDSCIYAELDDFSFSEIEISEF